MAYYPIGTDPDGGNRPTWEQRDGLGVNDPERVIQGRDFGTEFNAIKTEFDSLEGSIGTTRNVFAAVTYDGQNTVGTAHNVGQIQWKEQTAEGSTFQFAYIPFLIGFDGQANPNPNEDGQQIGNGTLNANLNIQVTAFSNANNSLGFAGFCFGTVTEIDNFHVEVAFSQNNFDGTHAAVWNQAFCLLVAKN